jgi:carbamoyl-phosphate synthase small subunit
MKAVISTEDMDKDQLVEKAKASPGLIGRDLVKEVTCPVPYHWEGRLAASSHPLFTPGDHRYRIIAMDFGIKHNILRLLESLGCDITVVPAKTTADEILSSHPDGIVLSNGPGDPEGVPYAIETTRQLIGKKPMPLKPPANSSGRSPFSESVWGIRYWALPLAGEHTS